MYLVVVISIGYVEDLVSGQLNAQGAGPLRGFIGLWAHCSLVVLVYEHSAVLILLVAEAGPNFSKFLNPYEFSFGQIPFAYVYTYT